MLNESGNAGTSPGEVFLVTFFVPASSLFLQLISSTFYSHKLFICLEVLSLNVVLLLALTSFSDHLVFLFLVYIVILFITFLRFACYDFTFRDITLSWNESVKERDFNKAYIGDYRGHLLLATSICILAVDFQFFPSKFAKTETYGWSVMDAGVGSFVVLHGLCSVHGKRINDNSLKKCLKSSFPLLLLGFLRLASTTAVGYHKVVSEYGVHWNFFFTLAFTKVICYSTLVKLNVNAGLLGTTTMIIHQLFLTSLGLSDLVLSSARRNLFEANKEGISSLLGFVSLYFFGVQMGHIAWEKKERMKDYFFVLVKLSSLGFCGWFLMYFFHENCQHVSRRMANLSYCIWIVSLTSLQISVHLCHHLLAALVNKLLKVKLSENLLWHVLNYNGLFYFLLANVLTGLVNITINTGDASTLKSWCILNVYLTILFVSSFILFKLNIKLL